MRLRTAAAAIVLLAGCARLDIPGIGLHDWVINGGQAEIDAGHITRVDLPGIWLAAHRTEAGGAFRNLPNMRIGDDVCLTGTPGATTCWHVLRKMLVPDGYHPPAAGLGPLVLQTSWPDGQDLLVICG